MLPPVGKRGRFTGSSQSPYAAAFAARGVKITRLPDSARSFPQRRSAANACCCLAERFAAVDVDGLPSSVANQYHRGALLAGFP